MRVRFEIDVKSRAARFLARLFKSEDLRVLYEIIGVGPCAKDIAVGIGDHRSHVRIRRSQPNSCASEFESAM